MIVSKKGKRDVQAFRQLDRIANQNQLGPVDLFSKVIKRRKEWIINPVSNCWEYAVRDENGKLMYATPPKTVRNRDIVAAKCILIKGKYFDISWSCGALYFCFVWFMWLKIISGYCELLGMDIPQTLQRPAGQQQQAYQPERPPIQDPALIPAVQISDDDHDDDDDTSQ